MSTGGQSGTRSSRMAEWTAVALLLVMSFGHSFGSADVGIQAVVTELPPPAAVATTEDNSNGLRLRVWPHLVKGLTHEDLNFTIRFVDPSCDPDDGCSIHHNDKPSGESKPIEIFFEVNTKFFEFYKSATGNESEYREAPIQSVVVDFYSGQAAQLNTTVHFTPLMLGFYDIRFYTLDTSSNISSEDSSNPNMQRYFSNSPMVITTIGRSNVQMLFYINMGVGGMIIVALFFMGIEIDLQIVLNVLKRPIGPAIGFVSQFLFMPLCAWGIGSVFLTQDYERLGLILLGSAPGGNLSNFWTSMFGGDVNLSVTMTMVSSLCSFGMTSLWVWLLGRQFSGERDIKIPYHMIAISLAAFIVPLCLGCLYKIKCREQATKVMNRFSKPFFMVCLVVVPSVGLLTNTYYFHLVTWRHLISGLLVGALGYLAGATLAYVCRQGRPQIIAISLETAIQNAGIAYLILSLSFPSPTAEIGLIPVISFFFCSTGPLLFIVYAVVEAYKRFFAKAPNKKVASMEQGGNRTGAAAVAALGAAAAEMDKMAVQYYQDVVMSVV